MSSIAKVDWRKELNTDAGQRTSGEKSAILKALGGKRVQRRAKAAVPVIATSVFNAFGRGDLASSTVNTLAAALRAYQNAFNCLPSDEIIQLASDLAQGKLVDAWVGRERAAAYAIAALIRVAMGDKAVIAARTPELSDAIHREAKPILDAAGVWSDAGHRRDTESGNWYANSAALTSPQVHVVFVGLTQLAYHYVQAGNATGFENNSSFAEKNGWICLDNGGEALGQFAHNQFYLVDQHDRSGLSDEKLKQINETIAKLPNGKIRISSVTGEPALTPKQRQNIIREILDEHKKTGQTTRIENVDATIPDDSIELEVATAVDASFYVRHLLTLGVDYIVDGGKIVQIEKKSGLPQERLSYPAHWKTALEAKENLKIEGDLAPIMSITYSACINSFGTVAGLAIAYPHKATATVEPHKPKRRSPRSKSRFIRALTHLRIFRGESAALELAASKILQKLELGQDVVVADWTRSADNLTAQLSALFGSSVNFVTLKDCATGALEDQLNSPEPVCLVVSPDAFETLVYVKQLPCSGAAAPRPLFVISLNLAEYHFSRMANTIALLDEEGIVGTDSFVASMDRFLDKSRRVMTWSSKITNMPDDQSIAGKMLARSLSAGMRGREKYSIRQAIKRLPEFIALEQGRQKVLYSYMSASAYHEDWRRYLKKIYDKAMLQIVDLELDQLPGDQMTELQLKRRTQEYIGFDPHSVERQDLQKVSSYKRRVWQQVLDQADSVIAKIGEERWKNLLRQIDPQVRQLHLRHVLRKIEKIRVDDQSQTFTGIEYADPLKEWGRFSARVAEKTNEEFDRFEVKCARNIIRTIASIRIEHPGETADTQIAAQ